MTTLDRLEVQVHQSSEEPSSGPEGAPVLDMMEETRGAGKEQPALPRGRGLVHSHVDPDMV